MNLTLKMFLNDAEPFHTTILVQRWLITRFLVHCNLIYSYPFFEPLYTIRPDTWIYTKFLDSCNWYVSRFYNRYLNSYADYVLEFEFEFYFVTNDNYGMF